MFRYSKSGRFLGFVRTVLKRDARGQAQKDTVQPSPAIPASSRPTKGQLRNPDTDYAADQAIDRLLAADEAKRRSGPMSSPKYDNPDTDYADDKALDELLEARAREKEANSPETSPALSKRDNSATDYAGDYYQLATLQRIISKRREAQEDTADRTLSAPPPSRPAADRQPPPSEGSSATSGDLLKQAILLGSQMALSEARRMLAMKARQASLTSPRKKPE